MLLWPLQISPGFTGAEIPRIRTILTGKGGEASAWQPVEDEFTIDPREFQERHYKEFVTFLPYVQRFIYGESRSARRAPDDPPAEASVEVFRRRDVAKLRIVLRPDGAPVDFEIAHIDLYLFRDLDVVVLTVELVGRDLPLADALDHLHRFGRAYPAGWDRSGSGLHNAHRAEWLDATGAVLVASDTARRDKYLEFVCRHRAPAIAAHWDFLLRPLVLDHADEVGALRYALVEYYRMPFMAYLAIDNPGTLSREEFVGIGLISQLRPGDPIPPRLDAEFEQQYCEDRYWSGSRDGPNTRFMANGQSLIAVGDAGSAYFTDVINGQLSQFRHQIFLLFLIAHMHRAALLSFSDRLADATNDLDIAVSASVRRFKGRIRGAMESFLRFTHRYWFHVVSEHALVQSLFQRTVAHLGNDTLYGELRSEIRDMSDYLDSDAQRRQSGTMMRLTVVTTFGLIGTVATGFLGMNLIAEADASIPARIGYFFVVLGGAALLTLFAVARSPRLAELLETLADRRVGAGDKLLAVFRVFGRER